MPDLARFCEALSLNFVLGIQQQEAGIVPFGVDFKNPNFAKVAEAMGAKGMRLEEPGDVKDALAEALAYKDGPVVVDAVVDRFALSLPSHVPFHSSMRPAVWQASPYFAQLRIRQVSVEEVSQE